MADRNGSALTAVDGFRIGVDMVRELKGLSGSFEIEKQYRAPGMPQHNVVAEYLQRIHATDNPEVVRGFASFLTEYVGSCASGCVLDLDIYERIVTTETI